MPVVQIEGVGNVQFPETMTEQDIGAAAHKLYTSAGAKSIEQNPPAAAGAPHPPTSGYESVPEERTEAGHKAAIQKRESEEGPVGQVGIGLAKAGGSIPFAQSVPKLLSGDTENEDLTAHGKLQTLGKVGGFGAMIGPSLVTAPVATVGAMGTGLLGQQIGKHGSKLLGASENASDVYGDVGGVAGGMLGSKVPKVLNEGRFGRLVDVAKKEGHIPILGKVQPYAEAWKTPGMSEGAPLPLNPEMQGEAAANLRALKQRGMTAPASPAPIPPSSFRSPMREFGKRLVVTPEEAAQRDQIQRIATRLAKERGMQYAGGMKPLGKKIPVE